MRHWTSDEKGALDDPGEPPDRPPVPGQAPRPGPRGVRDGVVLDARRRAVLRPPALRGSGDRRLPAHLQRRDRRAPPAGPLPAGRRGRGHAGGGRRAGRARPHVPGLGQARHLELRHGPRRLLPLRPLPPDGRLGDDAAGTLAGRLAVKLACRRRTEAHARGGDGLRARAGRGRRAGAARRTASERRASRPLRSSGTPRSGACRAPRRAAPRCPPRPARAPARRGRAGS